MELAFNNLTADRNYRKNFFEKIIESAAEEVGLGSIKIELSINLVGEGRIKSLNKKYRGRNRVTDVLSFPLQEKIGAKTRSSDIINLGDVFICLPVAKKYAVRERISLDYKLAFLAVHGFLHLLGHDHEEIGEHEAMFKLQNDILSKLKLETTPPKLLITNI